MCQISVVKRTGEQEELVMESVTMLEVKNSGVEVSTFFEEPKFVADSHIARIDFLGGKVFLEQNNSE